MFDDVKSALEMLLIFHTRGILQLSVIKYFIKEILSLADIDRHNEVFMVMNTSHTGEMTREELYECYQEYRYREV